LITSGGSSDTSITSKNNVLQETVLPTSLDKLITRDPSKFMRSLAQEINISEQLLERWCQRMGQVAVNCHYIFQQDSVPALNNKRTHDWLKESLTEVCEKEIWPPSSTDCYSFVWISLGVSGLRANIKPHNKTENLLPKIKEVMRSFDRNTMTEACMSFRSRMEAVFTANGSFIEYDDCQYVSLQMFFYFNKIGWFSAVLCHLKERRKKFRIYRCHPEECVVHSFAYVAHLYFWEMSGFEPRELP
jgi:hypothetical protein